MRMSAGHYSPLLSLEISEWPTYQFVDFSNQKAALLCFLYKVPYRVSHAFVEISFKGKVLERCPKRKRKYPGANRQVSPNVISGINSSVPQS